MKRFLILLTGIGILYIASAAQAQDNESVTVNESATISQPIRLYKNTDLNFGGMFSGISQGSIHVFGTIGALTIPPSGSPTAPTTTTTTYPGGSGPKKFIGGGFANTPAQVASFIVTGEPSLTYSISVAGGDKIMSGSGEQMDVQLDNPTGGLVNASGNAGTIQSTGAETGTDKFTIGGVLKVKAGQASGHYNGIFNVTVCYN